MGFYFLIRKIINNEKIIENLIIKAKKFREIFFKKYDKILQKKAYWKNVTNIGDNRFIMGKNMFSYEYKKIFTYSAIILTCLLIGIKIYSFKLSVVLLTLIIILAAIYFIFFKNNKLYIQRSIAPLLVTSVLLPSISFSERIPNVRLDFVIIFIAWVLFIFSGFVKGKFLHLRINPIFKWYILLGFVVVVSISFSALSRSYYPIGRDYWEIVKLLKYFLIFALISSIDIPVSDLQYYYKIALIIFLITSLIAFMQHINLYNINDTFNLIYSTSKATSERVVGTMGNPNEFGALMVMASSLAFSGGLFYKKRSIRFFSFFCLIIFFYSLLLTGSRTAFILFIIAICFILCVKYPPILVLKRKRMLQKFLYVLIIGVIISVIIVKLIPSDFFFRLKSLRDPFSTTSWQAKFITWNYVFHLVKSSPIFGWGPCKNLVNFSVDNEWLLILFRYGILGLSIFIFWAINILYGLYRIRKKYPDKEIVVLTVALQATLIACLINMIPAAFYHSLQLMSIVSIFLGLTFSQYKKGKNYKL